MICDDICHYMETTEYYFHVIVASDVLTYFGDLTKVFVRVSKSLTPSGLFFLPFQKIRQMMMTFYDAKWSFCA